MVIKRSNKKMSWRLCKKCGGRIYSHRPNSHICKDNWNDPVFLANLTPKQQGFM